MTPDQKINQGLADLSSARELLESLIGVGVPDGMHLADVAAVIRNSIDVARQHIEAGASELDKRPRAVPIAGSMGHDQDKVTLPEGIIPSMKLPGGGTYRDEPIEWEARLSDWRTSLSIIGTRVSATLQVVEQARKHEDVPWGVSGPLLLAEDALNNADDGIGCLQSDLAQFTKHEPAEAAE